MLSPFISGKQAGSCCKAQKKEEGWAFLSQKACHSVLEWVLAMRVLGTG